jgi:hypothetical protein
MIRKRNPKKMRHLLGSTRSPLVPTRCTPRRLRESSKNTNGAMVLGIVEKECGSSTSPVLVLIEMVLITKPIKKNLLQSLKRNLRTPSSRPFNCVIN